MKSRNEGNISIKNVCYILLFNGMGEEVIFKMQHFRVWPFPKHVKWTTDCNQKSAHLRLRIPHFWWSLFALFEIKTCLGVEYVWSALYGKNLLHVCLSWDLLLFRFLTLFPIRDFSFQFEGLLTLILTNYLSTFLTIQYKKSLFWNSFRPASSLMLRQHQDWQDGGEEGTWRQDNSLIYTNLTAAKAKEQKKKHAHTHRHTVYTNQYRDKSLRHLINAIYMWSILINSSVWENVWMVVNICLGWC